jgi:bacteriocin biosynthesis cyclodehydratase domain-containing protein
MPDRSEPEQAAPGLLRLRPGAAVYEISSDEVQISFPNYTVTFTSPVVTAAVLAILAAVGSGAERSAVVPGAVAESGLDSAVIEYLVESLLSSNCLALGRHEVTGPLQEFHAYLADSADDVAERLAAARCVLLQPAGDPGGLAEALRGLDLPVDIVEAAPGAATAPIMSALAEALESATVLGCWNVPYRSPFARQLNELTAAGTVPALFGSCEGVVGRVGPFVIPRNTACLECVNLRLLAHAGGPELHAYQQYRLRNEEVVPPAWPTHPLFVRAVAGLFGVELVEVAMKRPSATTGGFVEYRVGGAAAERHPVVRVPGCNTCRPQSPRRVAWDVRLPAPAVKGAAE